MCQVNVTRITRKVFEILNFVFGILSFVFRSPYSTVCSHMEPSANWGRQTGPLVEKLVAKLTTAAYDLVAKNIFWPQMATRRPDFSSPGVPLLHSLSSPHKCCMNTRASWHSTYRCHLGHAENQRQKFVVSHPDCAAGDLQLHERTVRMRVHGVRTDSLRALMRRPTQE